MSGEKIAGGMSYQTLKDLDYQIIELLLAPENSSEIFQKNKEYYIASANKTRARLILAKTRITNVKLKENEAYFLNQKISEGIQRLETLEIKIKNAEDKLEFQDAVSYKEWHAIKLIPKSVEGYASRILIKKRLEEKANKNFKYKEGQSHLKRANNIFLKLLDLDTNRNFKLAEKQLDKAYDELYLAYKYLD